MNRKIIVLALSMFLLAGCTSTVEKTSCSKQNVAVAADSFSSLISKWNDAFDLAGKTPRVSVTQPIIEMMHIKWDIEDLEVPNCLDKAKSDLVDSMSADIEGMTSFLAQESDATVNQKLTSGTELLQAYTNELQKAQKCAPNCK